MNKAAIYHRVDSEYCYALNEHEIVLRLRCEKNDINQVVVCYGNRVWSTVDTIVTEIPMTKVSEGSLHDYFEVTLNPNFRRVFYYFKLIKNNETLYYYHGDCHDELAITPVYYQL